MNKILLDKEMIIEKDIVLDCELDNYSFIKVLDNVNCELSIFINKNSEGLVFDILDGANVVVNVFGVDSSCSIKIDLGNNSMINFCYGGINYCDMKNSIIVSHLGNNSKSNIVNHFVNVLDNTNQINVDLIVPKSILGCSCIQDNKIINLGDGTGIILPNLLVDSYDTFAEHSAYISKFNSNQIFYLKSRGLNDKEVNRLLVQSFILGKMNISFEFRNRILEEIYKIGR